MPPNPVQFGTEQFVVSASVAEGVPDHAVLIEGRLMHLGVRNLAKWGVTADATSQIISGMPGIPIRACKSKDPHECDFTFDNSADVGYAVRSWVEGEWLMAAAAITDPTAVDKIKSGTWTPFGKGGWSVVGFPSKPVGDFAETGLASGFQPEAIALVLSPTARPAFVGSGFEMVAAAVNSNHRGDTMPEDDKQEGGGGNDPVTYTQDELDTKVKDALETQKTESDTEAKKIADAALAKNKADADDALAKQKLEYDEAVAKMTDEERAAYDKKLEGMTPTEDVEKMVAAAVTAAAAQTKADTLDAIERQRLTGEYGKMVAASVVLGAPYMTDGKMDTDKLQGKLDSFEGMKVAAISSLIEESKLMVAASTPAQSAFDAANVPGTPPGSDTQEAKDAAALSELRESTGRA